MTGEVVEHGPFIEIAAHHDIGLSRIPESPEDLFFCACQSEDAGKEGASRAVICRILRFSAAAGAGSPV